MDIFKLAESRRRRTNSGPRFVLVGAAVLGVVLSTACGAGAPRSAVSKPTSTTSNAFWQQQQQDEQWKRYQQAQVSTRNTQEHLNEAYGNSFRSGKCAHLPSSRTTC
jgi:hypothetical protein